MEIDYNFFALCVLSQNEVVQSVPQSTGTWMNYTWDNWDQLLFHERLKKSYDIMQARKKWIPKAFVSVFHSLRDHALRRL